MLGPTGVGVLYMRADLIDKMEPLCIGGGTIIEVGSDHYTLATSSKKFEAGTPAIAETIGLGAAIDYLKKIGLDNIMNYERQLTKKMQKGLAEVPNVEVYGPIDLEQRICIVPFNVGSLSPHDVALALDVSANIMVRSGHHCAMPLTKELLKKRDGTVRASLYLYNTEEEITRMISAVEEIVSS